MLGIVSHPTELATGFQSVSINPKSSINKSMSLLMIEVNHLVSPAFCLAQSRCSVDIYSIMETELS